MVTPNAQAKLEEAIAAAGIDAADCGPAQVSPAALIQASVHQGAVLEVKPLNWGRLEDVCIGDAAPRVLLLDRVTDPHNVGAILRSAEVLGASAVIGTRHHSAPETGALAKTASGALERQPYLRVRNLADAIRALQDMGYLVLGLDGEATVRRSKRQSRASGTAPWHWCWGRKGRACAQRPAKRWTRWCALTRQGSLARSMSQMRRQSPYMQLEKTHKAKVMGYPTKIATCCHCGSKAALKLDTSRHELSCASCGAPLRDLKMLPKSVETAKPVRRAVSHQPDLRHFPEIHARLPTKRPSHARSKSAKAG